MLNRLRCTFNGGVWQYILSFTSIVMIIIIVMGMYLYNYYYGTIHNDFVISNKEFLSIVANQHENDIAVLNDIALQFGISDSITPFSLEEQPVKSLPLKKTIKQYQMISQFYKQMYLIFRQDKYLYNDVTSVHINRFFDKGLILSNDSTRLVHSLLYESDAMKALREQSISGELVKEGDAVLYFVPMQPRNIGTLLFIVDDEYYDKLLESPVEELRTTYVLKDGQIIVSRGELKLDESIVAENLKQLSDNDYYEAKIDGQKYLFVAKQGVYGFQYCTVQSSEIFQRKFFSGQWGILFFILICAIPAAIFIVLLSRHLKQSIGDIKVLLQQENSKGNDFDTIQSGIRELVGHNMELSEMAQASISTRRSEMIRSFVRGTYLEKDTVIVEGKKVGLSLDKQYFMVVLIGGRRSEGGDNTIKTLLNLFSQENKVTGYGVELISHEQLLFVIFSNKLEGIEVILNRLNDTGKSLYENFVMATSSVHENFRDISIAYLEANTAYDNRFLVGNNEILQFSSVATTECGSPVPNMYIGALKNALRMGDEKSMNSAISEIFYYLRSSKQSLFTFRILYNEIIHVLIHEWNPQNIEFQRIYNIFALSRCLSLQELDDMLRDVCRILLDHNNVKDDTADNKMRRAVEYMRENYNNGNLNMNALAEYLSISTVTLSVEFKEAMGMSPSDYLTLLRIDRAKELLLESNLSVKEISGTVGYFDVPGFIRRFKKYTGKTPAQFRDSYLKEAKSHGSEMTL